MYWDVLTNPHIPLPDSNKLAEMKKMRTSRLKTSKIKNNSSLRNKIDTVYSLSIKNLLRTIFWEHWGPNRRKLGAFFEWLKCPTSISPTYFTIDWNFGRLSFRQTLQKWLYFYWSTPTQTHCTTKNITEKLRLPFSDVWVL